MYLAISLTDLFILLISGFIRCHNKSIFSLYTYIVNFFAFSHNFLKAQERTL